MKTKMSMICVVLAMLGVLAPMAPATALPRGLRVRTYKSDLSFPVDMSWVTGTRKVFFTEKNTGKIRILIGQRLKGRACANLDVNSDGEGGALGIELHPNFKRNHLLYVYYTNASPLENRVTRFKVVRGRCRFPKRILSGIDASGRYHHGGQLEFVGDHLFVSTGENHDAARAQDTDSRQGKILRLDPDGSIPDGNPFSTAGDPNPVWSYGHRNPFGLARKPGTQQLYETENGPNCDDEVNRILPGRNYGWGASYQCGTAGSGENPKRPLFRWRDPVAITDAWWYVGVLGRLSGDLYAGDFSTDRIHRFDLNDAGTNIRRHRIIHDSTGNITDVSKGPGGWLYFMTSSAIYKITRD